MNRKFLAAAITGIVVTALLHAQSATTQPADIAPAAAAATPAASGPSASQPASSVAAAPSPATAPASQGALDDSADLNTKLYITIFNFAGNQRLGTDAYSVADKIRIRIKNNHEGVFVLSRIETADFKAYPASTDPRIIKETMIQRAGCNIAVWGDVKGDSHNVTADLKCIDLSNPAKILTWTKTFSVTDNQRAMGEVARQVVEALFGPEWIPPQVGDEQEPTAFSGPPENPNGDFENGHTFWDPPDHAASFLEPGPKGHGTILRIRTDLDNDSWVDYHRNILLHLADPDKPPPIKTDNGYSSLGGNDGVHFCSNWITAQPGWRYWLLADAKCPAGTPMIFIKGYKDWRAHADGLPEVSLYERFPGTKSPARNYAALTPEERRAMLLDDTEKHPDRYRRECWRWYMNARPMGEAAPTNQYELIADANKKAQAAKKQTESDGWFHCALPFPPRGGLPPDVQWLQIQIYAYWGPGLYYFDNVHVYKMPGQTAPLPEEKARTTNYQRSRVGDSDPNFWPTGVK